MWMITLFVLIISTLILVFIKYIPKRTHKSPPLIGQYWIPFLGCAIQFGKDPPSFLLKCQQLHGNIFTLNVGGRLMTHLLDPENFDIFFAPSKSNQAVVVVEEPGHHHPHHEDDADAVSFDHGVQEFTARVFGLPTNQFLLEHQVLLTSLRTSLSPSKALPMYSHRFYNHLSQALDEFTSNFNSSKMHKQEQQQQRQAIGGGGGGKSVGMVDNLFEFVCELMFYSAMKSLFGESFFKYEAVTTTSSPDSDLNQYTSFRNLDKWFELAASGLIPHNLLGSFNKSKSKLISILDAYKSECYASSTSSSRSSVEPGIFQTLLESLERNGRSQLSEEEFEKHTEKHTLWGLALIWASQANSLPATFWTLIYLLNNETCMENVKKEIEQVMSMNSDSDPGELFTPEKLPYLSACVREGIRLQAPGILIRKVCKPIKLTTITNRGDEQRQRKTFVIPKGHTLCISPYVVHRNEQAFPNPEKFDPDRWLIGDRKYHEQMRKFFLSFGRGQNLCPGMNFAMVEMVSFLATLIDKFPHIHLKSACIPQADVTRMIGVPHPKGNSGAIPVYLFK